MSIEEKERVEREEMLARAREAHKEQREKEEDGHSERIIIDHYCRADSCPAPPSAVRKEFRKALNSDPAELRKAAEDIMEALSTLPCAAFARVIH